jgi:hypothetical protein
MSKLFFLKSRKTTKQMARENIYTITGPSTKARGGTINKTATERKFGLVFKII